MKSSKVFAPASVGNAAVGFDVLGFALDGVGDIVTVSVIDDPIVKIESITDAKGVLGHHKLPLDPTRNTAAVALIRMREELCLDHGFSIALDKGIAVGSGMGGSAASAVGAVVAANSLLDDQLSNDELLRFALLGELVASGSAHTDNIAPCLFGGLSLTVSIDPPRFVSIPVPDSILCVMVHPHIRLDTLTQRKSLRQEVALRDYVKQSANLAGFIAGCYANDLDLIRSSFSDVIIEPQRADRIPGFYAVKAAAIENGAIGAAISGAGPSVFAWVTSAEAAEVVKVAMVKAFEAHGTAELDAFISPISSKGARIIE
jgi:homoserine kinase